MKRCLGGCRNHNPFSSTTVFTYFLPRSVDKIEIKIYSVFEKFIYEFPELPTNIEYNEVKW